MARPSLLPQPVLVAPARTAVARALPRSGLAAERIRLSLVLLITLCQGALYLCLLPPWQHYDEPTHFEYAWLIANRPGLPQPGDADQPLRRELAASMLEHRFYWNLAQPTLLTDDRAIDIGITELGHPPGYYLLVSLPLRLVRHLDLASQLYVARAVSLALFVLAVAAAAGIMRELTPAGHDLRWAVPLCIALIPPVADLMTAVNNDVGAVAVFSLFLWGAVRSIRRGLSWWHVAWLLCTALLAVATKNTAALALPLAPLAALVAFWSRYGWRWRWLIGAVAVVTLLALPLLFAWGDAAYWYRGNPSIAQAGPARSATRLPTLGRHALAIEVPPGAQQYAISPLAGAPVPQLAGGPVTIGAWVWADRPALAGALGLAHKTPANPWAQLQSHALVAGPTPAFIAFTVDVPAQSYYLQYQISAAAPAGTDGPAHLFVDAAVVVAGAFPLDQAPRFDDAGAQHGVWAGRQFTNLLRNPSAEQGWPHLRATVDRLMTTYIHRSPAQSIAALLDVPRIAPLFMGVLLLPATDSIVQSFAWGNVRLRQPIWLYLARGLALLALAGGLRWLLARRSGAGLRPAVLFLLLVGLLIWANTIMRPLPLLGEMYIVPAARYTFPAIAVTALALVGGWRALWAEHLRTIVTFGLIGGLIILNGVAMQTIGQFYLSIPIGG